ncbi:hypothetical protein N7492_008708 [Penicillium capsulatum]|uniref:AT DNA binding protein n=1 Tax=Penicillium capsulatum TaxID=69766 RepID=A0A9W9LHJ3_9EURO|nr:hypothetical protein N7492_008708 [Penicillium capsulatum]
MSITSRSQSSSPDILGPPGDAEYLISSPIKPFVGRQSWVSPVNPRRQQTPAKRRRVSLSPAKSAHSIRFDDVLLPGSPTMKLDGRQRSLSPEKIQPEGDVSPWRIRVTLEATQDENEGGPSPKRSRPSTFTTKVPLKDERSPLIEKTPVRRRGRPRKSDLPLQSGSPWPGSPGNTPGPQGTTPQNGKRGRPRKGTPRPNAQDMDIDDKPTPALSIEPEYHASPMDTTADVVAEPGRHWSPGNLLAEGGYDSDSLGADDLPVAEFTMPTAPIQPERDNNAGREYGRASYDTPVIGDTEHHFQDNDENIHSTPSKMPSPSRDRTVSSIRSSRLAGHTSSPRTYPTPTPTSSLEDENHGMGFDDGHGVADEPLQSEDAGPAENHEEFDSIMESEGFTMISLDTLPSAKQHGLGSSTRTATDNPAKILQDRENGRIGERLKRKLPGTIHDLRNDKQSSARSSPAGEGRSPVPNTLARKSPPANVPYPDLPAVISPAKAASSPKRKPLTSLSKLVRVGMALQGPFRPPENAWAGDSNVNRKERLEDIFGTFSPDTRRELRAAMALGQELATRQTQAEKETEATAAEDRELESENYEEDDQMEEDDEVDVVIQSPQPQRSSRQDPTSATRITREVEWQMEREIVSRHAADPANSNRLIYIPSDEISQDDAEDQEELREEHPDDRSPTVESIREDVSIGKESFDEQPPNNGFDNFGPMENSPEQEPIEEPVQEEDEEHPDFIEEEPRGYESDHEPGPLRFNEQEMDMEPRIVDDDGSDIWQETRHAEPEAKSERSPFPTTSGTTDPEPEVLDDEDDGFDIWQEEARDHSHISQQSEHDQIHNQVLDSEPVSPWRHIAEPSPAQDYMSSSPAYVSLDQNDTLHLERNHIRQLQNRDIDLSALLAEEDTPNRARYYNGTSTPRSILSRRPGAQNSSNQSSAIKSKSPKKRVRLQTISQSPDREVEPAHEDNAAAPQDPQDPEPFQEPEIIDDGNVSDASVHDIEDTHEDVANTPEASRQADMNAPASSWLNRITSLTPRWLKAPTKDADDSSSVVSEEEPEDGHSEPGNLATVEAAKEISEDPESRSPSNRSSESPWRYVDEPEMPPPVEVPDHRPGRSQAPPGPRPLATFGFFSDAHYGALRRVYQMAKRHPDRFPYYDAPARRNIIGDWIWTSNGRHGVPITEAQFAIIDRFVHDLSRADAEFGGSGQVEWTEADLHRRLISIIIGEQIREERQAKATRGASVEPWR